MKLMDPFKDKETVEEKLNNLETLWFNTQEQEWLEQQSYTML